jgi:hypothetical protein
MFHFVPALKYYPDFGKVGVMELKTLKWNFRAFIMVGLAKWVFVYCPDINTILTRESFFLPRCIDKCRIGEKYLGNYLQIFIIY